MKKTMVLGASPNPSRTSFAAVERLVENGHEVIPIGIKPGQIKGVDIVVGRPKLEAVDTITLYLRPPTQKEYYDYILEIRPKRLIFNPGTENHELMQLARAHDITVLTACTLVMLSIGSY